MCHNQRKGKRKLYTSYGTGENKVEIICQHEHLFKIDGSNLFSLHLKQVSLILDPLNTTKACLNLRNAVENENKVEIMGNRT